VASSRLAPPSISVMIAIPVVPPISVVVMIVILGMVSVTMVVTVIVIPVVPPPPPMVMIVLLAACHGQDDYGEDEQSEDPYFATQLFHHVFSSRSLRAPSSRGVMSFVLSSSAPSPSEDEPRRPSFNSLAGEASREKTAACRNRASAEGSPASKPISASNSSTCPAQKILSLLRTRLVRILRYRRSPPSVYSRNVPTGSIGAGPRFSGSERGPLGGNGVTNA